MPLVNIDFFTPVESDGTPADIAAAVLAAAKMPAKDRLKYRNSVYSDFLERAKLLTDGTVLGSAARVRMKGLPGKFNSENYTLSHLDLLERDGVSEEVHFLIDTKLQVVALQRNGHFRSTQVETLLSDLTALPVTLQPKVRKDMWNRLTQFDHINKLGFKLRDPGVHPDFSDSIPAVGKTIDDVGRVGELASIEVIIKLKRDLANPQDVSKLKNLVKAFFKSGNAEKLYAAGRKPDEKKAEPVDFLRDRIVASGEVEYGNGRRLDGEECKRLLRSALETHRTFLEGLVIQA